MALEALSSPILAAPLLHNENAEDHYVEPWAKSKRSKRPWLDNPPTEEEYLALCLMLGGGQGGATTMNTNNQPPAITNSPLQVHPQSQSLPVLPILPSTGWTQGQSPKACWSRRPILLHLHHHHYHYHYQF
jgi:hypothetical protein